MLINPIAVMSEPGNKHTALQYIDLKIIFVFALIKLQVEKTSPFSPLSKLEYHFLHTESSDIHTEIRRYHHMPEYPRLDIHTEIRIYTTTC